MPNSGGGERMDAGSRAQQHELMQWCTQLPKVELHAHLNGSIRDSTLLELAEEHGRRGTISFPEVKDIILKEDRSLQECFKLFDVIHILTTDHAVITRITKEVIEDFAAEKVVYLELRTTPKNNEAVGMSKRSYVEAVIAGMRGANVLLVNEDHTDVDASRRQIYVRLLLSIDRRENVDAAIETVQLALEMKKNDVVGIDLSGNPATGNWKSFLPALACARMHGLPVTLHCGEVYNPDEVQAMLAFRPERLGHVCILQDSQWEMLLNSTIPVEVCLTSNVRTKCVQSICDHHFASLYKSNHPMIICTDDRGVFSTSLSREYALAATCFGLSKMELLTLAKSALNFIFADAPLKQKLQDTFSTMVSTLAL